MFGEWISVEDRLPEKAGRYLVAYAKVEGADILPFAITKKDTCDFDGPGFYEDEYNEWGEFSGCFRATGVTHWMPLPEPPKGE